MTERELHPMEIPPEHDPEVARNGLRRQLEELAWDATESGMIDVGDERVVREPALLSPRVSVAEDAEEFEWTFTYRGGQEFAVTAPDGVEEGSVELPAESDDDILTEIDGDVVTDFHRRRQVEFAQDELDDPGDKVFLPILRYAELLEGDEVGLVWPQAGRDPDPDVVIDRDAFDVDAIHDAVEAWRDQYESPLDR